MDFFAVPTVTFKLLYCFFVIEHGRRRILHFNVTSRPSSEWVVQELREAFPEFGQYRYLIFDHDAKFNEHVIAFLEGDGTEREAHQHSSSLAKWHGRALGRKLSTRGSRPYYSARRITLAAADWRVCEVSPRGPDSRCPAERQSASTDGGD